MESEAPRCRAASFVRVPFFAAVLLFCAGCSTTGHFSPAVPVQNTPYIIVYGRDDCPACETVKKELAGAGLPYAYKDMRDENVRREVRSRMEKAGMDTGRIPIPVVDVNGDLAIRPSLRDIQGHYGCSDAGPKSGSETPCLPCREGNSGLPDCAGQ